MTYGTQRIYYDRADVLTLSLDQDRCVPLGDSGEDERGEGEGLGANINIPLPAGSGHEAYVATLRTIVVPALERFRPQIIIVASGLDANAADPLGRQLLHSGMDRAAAHEFWRGCLTCVLIALNQSTALAHTQGLQVRSTSQGISYRTAERDGI